MELANALVELWSRKWLVLLVVVVSAIVGILLAFDVSTDPLKLEKKGLQVGSATTQVYVDTRDPSVDTLSSRYDPFKESALIQRAHTLARLMPSYDIRAGIAKRLGVSANDIAVTPPTDPAVSGTRPEPSGSQRASALIAASSGYQLTIGDSTQAPTIDITGQTTDPAKAAALVTATVGALQGYLSRVRQAGTIPRIRAARVSKTLKGRERRRVLLIERRRREVAVRALGPPISGTITTGANVQLAIAGAVATFVLGCLLILGIAGMGRGVREARRRQELDSPAPPAEALRRPQPNPTLPSGGAEDVVPAAEASDGAEPEPVAGHGDT